MTRRQVVRNQRKSIAAPSPPVEPRERGKRWEWRQEDGNRAEWFCDNPPARIYSMPARDESKRTYSVYVEKQYWGTKPTFDDAVKFAKGAKPPRQPFHDEPGFAEYAARQKADETARNAEFETKLKERKANTAKLASAAPTVEQEQRTRAKVAAATTGANTKITGFKPSDVITVKNTTNPRKKGTVQWDRYEVIKKFDGQTVQAYSAGGGDISALKYAVAQLHVVVNSS